VGDSFLWLGTTLLCSLPVTVTLASRMGNWPLQTVLARLVAISTAMEC
jgi:hypothetical protein